MRRSGQYAGDEATRLATLKYAAVLGADYIDVELKAAPFFFAGAPRMYHCRMQNPFTCDS